MLLANPVERLPSQARGACHRSSADDRFHRGHALTDAIALATVFIDAKRATDGAVGHAELAKVHRLRTDLQMLGIEPASSTTIDALAVTVQGAPTSGATSSRRIGPNARSTEAIRPER